MSLYGHKVSGIAHYLQEMTVKSVTSSFIEFRRTLVLSNENRGILVDSWDDKAQVSKARRDRGEHSDSLRQRYIVTVGHDSVHGTVADRLSFAFRSFFLHCSSRLSCALSRGPYHRLLLYKCLYYMTAP